MKRAALSFAWSCFAVSVVVHAASFIGVSLFEQLVFLHFGVFALGIPAVFSAKNRSIRRGPWWPPGASPRALAEGGPRWGARALTLGYIYFIANLAALFLLGEGGSPSIRDGKYILQSHGRLIRELTASECRWQLSHVSRMFSAGWALAYLLFIVWYWVPKASPRSPT